MFWKKVDYQYSASPVGERNLSKCVKKIIPLFAGSVHFTEQAVDVVTEMIAVYFGKHTKHAIEFCGQKGESF
jgi:hypothetical protein